MASANYLRGFNASGMAMPLAATNTIVSASNAGIAWTFQANSNDPITHLGFLYGVRTGTPPTYSIRLESLDGSGLPGNTDVGGGSPTAATFTPPADATWNSTWQWIALTNAFTPTRGQILVITIRYSSGTIDGSNNSSFARSAGAEAGSRGFPYALTLSGGTWSKSSTPCCGYRTANGRYGTIYQSTYTTATANTATHKSGMYFTLPSGWGTSFQLAGIQFVGRVGAAAGSTKIGLWDTSGTLLQSVSTWDSDFTGNNGAAVDSAYAIYFQDSTLATLSYGTKYYVGLEVISGAVAMTGIVLAEAADRSAYPNGLNRGLVTYNGSFTETDTILPMCDLILNDITVPSGGGAAGRRNMRGGFIN